MGLQNWFRKRGMVKKGSFDSEPEMTQCEVSSANSDNNDQGHIVFNEPLTAPPKESAPTKSKKRSLSRSSRSRRLSYREKKERFRAALGIGEFATVAAAKGEALSEEIFAKKNFHYFWCSRFWIRIYVAVAFTLLSRNPVLLHSISIIILHHMAERALVWGTFLTQSKEAKAGIQHFRWMLNFTLDFLEKALEGGRFHGYLAAKTYHFWTGTGKEFLISFFRQQIRDIRSEFLNDTRGTLKRQDLTRKRPKWGGFHLSY